MYELFDGSAGQLWDDYIWWQLDCWDAQTYHTGFWCPKDVNALIVGSPVYYGQPNGALLSIIQRAFYSNGANISGKPAASIAVCRRGGATAVFETLNMPFQMMNMPIVTSQYWNIVYGRAEGEAAMDTEGLQTMRTLARNMAWLLKSTNGAKAPGLPAEEPRQAMHFIR